MAETNTNMLLVFNSKCSKFSPMPHTCCVCVCGLLKKETSEYFFRTNQSPQRFGVEDNRHMRAWDTLTQDSSSQIKQSEGTEKICRHNTVS